LLWAAHFYLAFAFFAVVLMHIAAALFHALVRRDGVFDAMAPWPSHDRTAALRGFDHGNSPAVRAAAAPSTSLEETT
jgi:hypothetical protein